MILGNRNQQAAVVFRAKSFLREAARAAQASGRNEQELSGAPYLQCQRGSFAMLRLGNRFRPAIADVKKLVMRNHKRLVVDRQVAQRFDLTPLALGGRMLDRRALAHVRTDLDVHWQYIEMPALHLVLVAFLLALRGRPQGRIVHGADRGQKLLQVVARIESPAARAHEGVGRAESELRESGQFGNHPARSFPGMNFPG